MSCHSAGHNPRRRPMMADSRKVLIDNLLTLEIRPIRDFSEFIKRWQAAITIEEMLGLLHFGFSVPFAEQKSGNEYDAIDRNTFYFSIAEDWCEDPSPESAHERRQEKMYMFDRF